MSEPVEDAAEAAIAPDDAIVLEGATEDRILTIPNAITVVRLCTLPLFVYLLFGADDRWTAGWVLFAIGSTDWLDGYLARRLGQVSTVGKILDPVADRLLFFVGVVSIIIDGSVPLWFAVAVLVREVAVAAGTLSLAAMGATRIDVTWYGKAATFLLMGAFPAFLVGASDHDTADGFRILAWSVGIPGLALAYWSALLYVPLGRKALREGRAERAVRDPGAPTPIAERPGGRPVASAGMNVPDDLAYSSDHEWVRRDGERSRVGITDYAQDALGDVVYVQLPEVGAAVTAGEAIAEVESTKSVSDIYAPLSGTIVEVNADLADTPERLNEDPYGEGWMFVIETGDGGTELLDADAYRALIEG